MINECTAASRKNKEGVIHNFKNDCSQTAKRNEKRLFSAFKATLGIRDVMISPNDQTSQERVERRMNKHIHCVVFRTRNDYTRNVPSPHQPCGMSVGEKLLFLWWWQPSYQTLATSNTSFLVSSFLRNRLLNKFKYTYSSRFLTCSVLSVQCSA